MPTHDERVSMLEQHLATFKKETVQAYQDMSMELVSVKGMADTTVRRLISMKSQIDDLKQDMQSVQIDIHTLQNTMISRLAEQDHKMDTRFAEQDKKFDALEHKMDTRFAEQDKKFEAQDQKLDRIVSLLSALNDKLS